MTPLDTMKQALEALESFSDPLNYGDPESMASFARKHSEPFRTLIEQIEKAEPVARLCKYIGNDAYVKRPDKLIARTYAELPNGTYSETWEKVAELYAFPPAFVKGEDKC